MDRLTEGNIALPGYCSHRHKPYIVEKLGGEVGVESAGVSGEGSIFTFTLSAYEAGRGEQ